MTKKKVKEETLKFKKELYSHVQAYNANYTGEYLDTLKMKTVLSFTHALDRLSFISRWNLIQNGQG